MVFSPCVCDMIREGREASKRLGHIPVGNFSFLYRISSHQLVDFL
jgi:hypothetical protein